MDTTYRIPEPVVTEYTSPSTGTRHRFEFDAGDHQPETGAHEEALDRLVRSGHAFVAPADTGTTNDDPKEGDE